MTAILNEGSVKDTIDRLIEAILPINSKIINYIGSIDSKMPDKSALGTYVATVSIFVTAVVSVHLATLNTQRPNTYPNIFRRFWIRHIVSSYSYCDNLPTQVYYNSLAQRYLSTYAEMFIKTIDPRNTPEITHNNAVQLAWELYTAAALKKEPDDILTLVTVSPLILDAAMDILVETKLLFDNTKYPSLILPSGIPLRRLIEKEYGVKLPINDSHGMREEMPIQIFRMPNEQYLFTEAKYLHFYYRLKGMRWDVRRMETIEFNDRILHKLVIHAVYDGSGGFMEEVGSLYFDITDFMFSESGKSIAPYKVKYFDYHGFLQEKGFEISPFRLN